MKFYNNPNFVVLQFHCPYCDKETTITVHEDGACVCNACSVEAKPPMCYEQAVKYYKSLDIHPNHQHYNGPPLISTAMK